MTAGPTIAQPGSAPLAEVKSTHFTKSWWFRLYAVTILASFPVLLYLGGAFFQAYLTLPSLPGLNSNDYIMKRLNLRDWVTLDHISRHAVDAVVVSEDDGFFQNRGIEWDSVKQALREDWEAGRLKRGGSTLTQQVVKNVFLTRHKTLSRKIAEMVLASQVPRFVPKKESWRFISIAPSGVPSFTVFRPPRSFISRKFPLNSPPRRGPSWP